MKKTHKIRYTLLGALLTVLISQLCVPALAALAKKTIDVYTGVNIYVDDVKLEPKDANGNPVEVFVYNGTTYLPVRAVGEAYGKVVQWDGSTQTVYLGTHSSTTPTVMLKDLDYFTGEKLTITSSDKDNLGNTYAEAITNDFENTYKLNGQYSKMTGTLYQRYIWRSSSYTSSLKIYGDGKLLYDATVATGVEPLDFDINLTGVLEMKIVFNNFNINSGYNAGIGNCGLYT
jgi:hypothetical protein